MAVAFPVQIKSIQLHIRELDEDSQCSDEVRTESRTYSTCGFPIRRNGIIGHKEAGKGKIIITEWFIYLILSPVQYQGTFLYCNNGVLDTGNSGVVGHVKS